MEKFFVNIGNKKLHKGRKRCVDNFPETNKKNWKRFNTEEEAVRYINSRFETWHYCGVCMKEYEKAKVK